MILLSLTTHLVLGSTGSHAGVLSRTALPLPSNAAPPFAAPAIPGHLDETDETDDPVDPLTAACNAFLSSPLDLRRSVVARIRERVENHPDPSVQRLIALRNRAREELDLSPASELEFFDAERYARGQPVRRFMAPDSDAALDFAHLMGRTVEPIDVRRVVYDWGKNDGIDTGRVLTPDDLLWNYLYGYVEESDRITAWLQKSLDHESSHDPVALYFQNAYSDLFGRGRPDLSLYDAYAAFQGVDMPDVEVIAFAENILGETDWVSPIPPGARQNALFERIHNRFLSYYRYRTLLEYVSDLWINPESPLDWSHESLRERILYAFHLDDLDLEKVRERLSRTRDRGGFIAEMDRLADEDSSWRWFGRDAARRINETRWIVALEAQAVLREQGFLIDAASEPEKDEGAEGDDAGNAESVGADSKDG